MGDKAGISEISGLDGNMDNCWEKGTNKRRNIGFSFGSNYSWFFIRRKSLVEPEKLGSYYLFNHVLCKILEKLMVIVWFKSLWRDVNYLDLFQSFLKRFFLVLKWLWLPWCLSVFFFVCFSPLSIKQHAWFPERTQIIIKYWNNLCSLSFHSSFSVFLSSFSLPCSVYHYRYPAIFFCWWCGNPFHSPLPQIDRIYGW